MTRTRLFQLLDTLNKDEWTLIKKSIEAWNKSDSQKLELFSLIYKYRKDDSLKKFNADYIHNHSFANLSSKSFKNLLSFLQKDILKILTIAELEKDEGIFKSAKLKVLRDKGLYDWHDTLWTKNTEYSKKNPISRYSNFYKLKNALDTYLSNHPIKEKDGEFIMKKILDYRDNYYLDTDILISAIGAFREEIYKEDWSIIPKVSKDSLTSELQLALYHLICIRRGTNLKSAKIVRNFLFSQREYLTRDLKTLFAFGLVQHSKERKPVNEKIAANVLDMYKFMDQEDLLLVSSKIHGIVFLNIINTSISVFNNDLEWADYFYNRYKNKINDNQPNHIRQVAQAIMEFGKKNFEKVLEILGTTSPKQKTSKSITYSLEIRSFYKLGVDDDVLDSKIRNFREWQKRHKNEMSNRIVIGLSDLNKAILMMRNNQVRKLFNELESGVVAPFYKAWVLHEIKKMG